MTIYSDFITAIIGGVDLSDYVITYNRTSSLCEPGQLFSLVMTRKKKDGTLIDVEVSDSVTLKEKYTGSPDLTLKGYVTSVEIDANSAKMTIRGSDRYILLADYFIDKRLETGGESVGYWIEYICGLVNLNVQFDSPANIATAGNGDEEGTPLGMQTALDAIKLLERKGAVYTRYDSDLDKIVVYRLTSSEPKVTINSSNLLTFDKTEGTAGTRNVIKVWGGYRYDWTTGKEQKFNATASAEIPELPVDKTVLVASPEIRSLTFANIVANRILAVTAELDDLLIAECAGLYPARKIGDWAYISISQGIANYSRSRQITSIAITVDTSGAQTAFTFGEKCPRMSISPPVTPVYVTDTDDGVGISWDAGESFALSNTGLTGNALYGKSIAVNNYGRQMVITAAGLYKRFSDLSTWTQVTNLPNPTNESNDPDPLGITNLELVKVVDEPLKPYTFHILASGGHPSGWYRDYIYTTEDYGYSWKTTQMWTPAISGGQEDPYYQEHPTAPSGKVFDVFTHDITASLGNEVYVLVSSPVLEEEQNPETIYILEYPASNSARASKWDGTTKTIQHTVNTAGFIITARLWSCPTDRNICYMAVISNDGPDSTYSGAKTYLAKTTDGGTTWSNVHNGILLLADSDNVPISSYGINFDPSSTETEVRVAFVGFTHVSAANTCTAKARFIESVPNGSTSYTDVTSSTINLDTPSLNAGESFGGYQHGIGTSSINFNYPDKSARVDDYMWGCVGFYGAIIDPSRVGTGKNVLIVRLRYSTHTVEEFNQKVWRITDTNNIPAQIYLYSARSSSELYAHISYSPSLYRVTNSTWSSLGTVTLGKVGFPAYNSSSELYIAERGYPNNDYRFADTSGNETTIDFAPNDATTTPNRYHFCSINKQFESAPTYWCESDVTTLGDPDGFCYSTDGENWTQYWSGIEEIVDFTWRTWK